MFHLVDFQVTIAEILIIIMRTFRIAIWNLDVNKFNSETII
ncbi:hypothetical protein [SARS coronavirus TWJ]|nr:hypothetical protein [SARS coronavirus TWJ]